MKKPTMKKPTAMKPKTKELSKAKIEKANLPLAEKTVGFLKDRCKDLKIKGFSKARPENREEMARLIEAVETKISDGTFVNKDKKEYITLKREVETYEIICLANEHENVGKTWDTDSSSSDSE
jgi:hypothetical protein